MPGPRTFGGGHNYPGAALPFGMVQWSPDTTPAAPHSGGYDYRDHHVSGFSLTHLSGAGCAVYGDFPFLPTTEALTASPAPSPGRDWRAASSRASRTAARAARRAIYSVELRPRRGGPIGVALTATTRTGFARFTFPRSPHASVLIDAGGSAQPDDEAAVQVDPAQREITGSAAQRPLLRPAPALQGLLRRPLRPPLRRLRDLDEGQARTGERSRRRHPGPAGEPEGDGARRRLRDLRHPPATAR